MSRMNPLPELWEKLTFDEFLDALVEFSGRIGYNVNYFQRNYDGVADPSAYWELMLCGDLMEGDEIADILAHVMKRYFEKFDEEGKKKLAQELTKMKEPAKEGETRR